MKIRDGARSVRDISATSFLTVYHETLDSMKSMASTILPARTLHAVPYSFNMVVIGELHEPSTVDWLDGLPSPGCLKTLGFQKIEAGVEGYPYGRSLDGAYIRKDRSMQLQMEYRARKTSLTVAELMQNWPEDLKANYYAGQLVDNPSNYRLTEILDSYRRAGLYVIYLGLETPTYNSLENSSQ